MHFFSSLPASLVATILAIATAPSECRSIIPSQRSSRLLFDESNYQQQQQRQQQEQKQQLLKIDSLSSSSPEYTLEPQHVTAAGQHFDVQENSIGVLFTRPTNIATDARAVAYQIETLHLWLPLGKKVFTRDSPLLPLHPLSARITTLITSTPEPAAPQQIEKIECCLYGAGSGSDAEEEDSSKVKFSWKDNLVHFAPSGKEIESYECYVRP
ncbi:hypothetical protein SMMN14_07989 [Sphaerulina musiva]